MQYVTDDNSQSQQEMNGWHIDAARVAQEAAEALVVEAIVALYASFGMSSATTAIRKALNCATSQIIGRGGAA